MTKIGHSQEFANDSGKVRSATAPRKRASGLDVDRARQGLRASSESRGSSTDGKGHAWVMDPGDAMSRPLPNAVVWGLHRERHGVASLIRSSPRKISTRSTARSRRRGRSLYRPFVRPAPIGNPFTASSTWVRRPPSAPNVEVPGGATRSDTSPNRSCRPARAPPARCTVDRFDRDPSRSRWEVY